jgi:hypothetical protein
MSTGEVFLDEIPNQGLDRPLEIDALHLRVTQSSIQRFAPFRQPQHLKRAGQFLFV